jgi:uncharacterized repeat protein (TIGR03803 family)
MCVTVASGLSAQTFTTLVNFDGANGAEPWYMSLVQGPDGSFYGTTAYGGSENICGRPPVCGTIFKITSDGVLATLHLVPADGSEPLGGLTLALNGNFYATAYQDGANGGGTILEITRTAKVTTLYSFCAQPNCTDGFGPQSALVEGADGSFYGTTPYGGADDSGVVFKITSKGALTTLHSFDGTDGDGPFAGLVLGPDGNFYGTTYVGGANNDGTVFKISPWGAFTTLHNFDLADGRYPFGALALATDGNFYGTTSQGGANGLGTVFKITPGGKLTTIYNFCPQPDCTDGNAPYGGLVQGTDGNFYGTTQRGGTSNEGTVFEVTTGGTLMTLHNFDSNDGAQPLGGLLQGTDGNFYGTTTLGGDFTCNLPNGCGAVFSLSTGLSPFVALVRSYGKVGQTGPILGQGFTGTSNVMVNGIPASFTVISDTYLRATVPVGATTGYVTVTTPGGTLTSNVPFHVIP